MLQVGLVLGWIVAAPIPAVADEGGGSFWLPGDFASFAANPLAQGWSAAALYYHSSVWTTNTSTISVGQLRQAQILTVNSKQATQTDYVFLTPSYVFATPVLGAQAAVNLAGILGRSDSALEVTQSAASAPAGSFRGRDTIADVGELVPQAALRWNAGVNNFLTYARVNVPVGSYQQNRLTNLGGNHWAVDAGGGYTFFDPASGREFSAVMGFTYNFINPATEYQSGIDLHIDWAAVQLLNAQWFVGIAGYYYNQITGDSGAGDHVGGYKSRVVGLGPQVGYTFLIGGRPASLGVRGYGEFAAMNRPSGWNVRLSFSIPLTAPAAPVK